MFSGSWSQAQRTTVNTLKYLTVGHCKWFTETNGCHVTSWALGSMEHTIGWKTCSEIQIQHRYMWTDASIKLQGVILLSKWKYTQVSGHRRPVFAKMAVSFFALVWHISHEVSWCETELSTRYAPFPSSVNWNSVGWANSKVQTQASHQEELILIFKQATHTKI